MFKYYIDHKRKQKEIPLWLLEKFNSILIESTTMEQAFIKSEKHYVIGLIDTYTDIELLKEFDEWWDDKNV